MFLLAATLRPETMYGQTNCWALPEGDYGAFLGRNNEVYVMSARCAAYADRACIACFLPHSKRCQLSMVHARNIPHTKCHLLRTSLAYRLSRGTLYTFLERMTCCGNHELKVALQCKLCC